MARRCGPNHPCGGGMQKGLFNSFFGLTNQSLPITDTTIDGKQVEVNLGDSRALAVGEVVGPTTLSGTCYEYVSGSEVELTTADVSTAATGSQYKKYALDRNADSGKKPVFISCGSSGSTVKANGGDGGNNWSSTGTLRASAISKTNSALTYYGLTKPYVINVILGINDVKNGVSTNAEIITAFDEFFDWVQATWPGVTVRVSMIGRYASTLSNDRTISVSVYFKRRAKLYSNVYIVGALNSYYNWNLYKTSPATEPLHLTQAGNNKLGEQTARFEKYKALGFNKWAISILSSMYSDPGLTKATAINNFIVAQETNYLTRDTWFMFKQAQIEETFADWALIGLGNNVGAVFTANSYMASSSTGPQYINGLFNPAFSADVSSQNDINYSLRLAVNGNGLTTGYLFGGQDAATKGILLFQVSSSLRYTINDITGAIYSGETKFADNSRYGVYRSGTTKGLRKNGVSIHNATLASTGFLDKPIFLGTNNSNGSPSNTMILQMVTCDGGAESGFDALSWHNAVETLLTAMS
jgi:hypothetical protein